MSANRNRLTSALRRIVKTDPEVRSLLNAAESKGGKPGAAGVGSSTEAKQAQVCCDGTVGDANPGTGERDPDSGGQDGGLDSADPAKLSMGEGTLSGVTDCATGEPICFDGAGFIPPDGWDAPNDPPLDQDLLDEYSSGFYWFVYNNSADEDIFETPTRSDTLSQFEAFYGVSDCDTALIDGTGTLNCSGISLTNFVLQRGICGASTEPYCNPGPDYFSADSWPSDSCVNLAIVGGKIVGSKYDPENDGSYSAPRDSIDLCSGADQISLAPAANGGWKTINSDSISGFLYDSSGKVISHIDGNEYSDPAI